MTLIDLGEPPHSGAVDYTEYRPWLLEKFYYRFCSYCLVSNPVVHVDHYEPRRYAPHRVDDPENLLLACPACNGRGGNPSEVRRERCEHVLDELVGHLARQRLFFAVFDIEISQGLAARLAAVVKGHL